MKEVHFVVNDAYSKELNEFKCVTFQVHSTVCLCFLQAVDNSIEYLLIKSR